MLKLIFAIFVGLVGAAVLHLVILLSTPHFSNRDAYTRAVAEGAANLFHLLDDSREKTELGSGDPFMRVAVCTFDISDKPVRLEAFGAVPFWSVAIFDSASNEIFSMNDRTSAGGELDILVANQVQLAAIRKAQPAALSQSILVEAAQNKGYAVLRTMVPQPSFVEEATRFLGEAKCAQTAGQ
ncbi:DUF1254 domain-containing protein [Agrobacterium rubi]|uniref:DUF1254 domain-containing protein n=1 Tax=Agrobacterium rubi TaxID=28099 RepID=A0AAE7R8R7_9HYPH|nr:DUF1254 domain-containing protein [Agrobacterium rubi]NTE85753.1 DUF1254 domain-containing protein [Agrobacterium rubi]NTF01685.1 DUF1254 domain-containing protein [Agrobacterium rubi]NTF35928.1 DUF1254 domain-containing protein [Agrobacterium rubi]OCJ53256.1 hypothetical protein A6U92_25205 [Agrobacterium rubi]QTG01027.1 DUF1254 domain-containing protein [Agrobacterium rubi]